MKTYLVDAFLLHGASALAANAILRSAIEAVLPLAGPAMYKRLGEGWNNSLLCFIAAALFPIPIPITRYDEWPRIAERFEMQFQARRGHYSVGQRLAAQSKQQIETGFYNDHSSGALQSDSKACYETALQCVRLCNS